MSFSPLLIVAVASIAALPFVAVFALVRRDAPRTAINRTLATIERGYSARPATAVSLSTGAGGSLLDRARTGLTGRLGALGALLTSKNSTSRLQRWLDYAGNPVAWPAERVIAGKGLALALGGLLGALFGLSRGGLGNVALYAAVGAVIGYFGPDAAIYNTGLKRQEELGRSLPDTLDTLTICVEAGQGFDAALAQVSRNGHGPMVGETARVLQEMRIGKTRTEALRAMADRTKVPELRSFAAAIIQASDLGVAVGQVLREQAKEMRVRRRQKAEEIAQKIPVKILFPTLFCLFPALFVVILGPGIINIVGSMRG